MRKKGFYQRRRFTPFKNQLSQAEFSSDKFLTLIWVYLVKLTTFLEILAKALSAIHHLKCLEIYQEISGPVESALDYPQRFHVMFVEFVESVSCCYNCMYMPENYEIPGGSRHS